MKDTVTIDMAPYIRPNYRHNTGLWGIGMGRKAAKEHQITTLGDKHIVLKIPQGIKWDESFLKGFIGPVARKVGPENLEISVQGGFSGTGYGYGYFPQQSSKDQLNEYLIAESHRIKKRTEKKSKESKNGDWSEPITFFVPEIGTHIRLEDDWGFRLYSEGRNHSLYTQLPNLYKTTPERWEWRRQMQRGDIVFKAGAIFTVSRVYIRQGGKEYSSLTFNVKKGAVVITGSGEVILKKSARFWAKLSDVNKMSVAVDRNTLAEN